MFACRITLRGSVSQYFIASLCISEWLPRCALFLVRSRVVVEPLDMCPEMAVVLVSLVTCFLLGQANPILWSFDDVKICFDVVFETIKYEIKNDQ